MCSGSRGVDHTSRGAAAHLERRLPPRGPLTTLVGMSSGVNGSVLRGVSEGDAHEGDFVEPAWRDHFLRVLTRSPRFDGPRRFLQKDVAAALGQAIHRDASVLEAGVGSGQLLSSLPNAVRWGIDVLPEAVERAQTLDPTMTLSLGDAASANLGRQFDAIICDRLCHTVPDIQRLLHNMSAHLAPGGRLFLTAFNFLWWLPLRV